MSKQLTIGILVSSNEDGTAQEIYKWLLYFGHNPILINEKILVENKSLFVHFNTKETMISIECINGSIISFNEIDYFYQRKWTTQFLTKEFTKQEIYEKTELNTIKDFVLLYLKRKNKLLGFCHTWANNKLYQLQIASECGLIIPETWATNTNKHLVSENGIVAKSIQNPFMTEKEEEPYSNYTTLINTNELEDNFTPYLFQKVIKKVAEYRVFYLLGDFYPMKVVSYEFDNEIDTRLLMAERKVSYVPVQLNKILAEKLVDLMNKLELTMGSIDLLEDEKGDFYFLEVNPFGQFGMTSKPCNYYLEKNVAEKLIAR